MAGQDIIDLANNLSSLTEASYTNQASFWSLGLNYVFFSFNILKALYFSMFQLGRNIFKYIYSILISTFALESGIAFFRLEDKEDQVIVRRNSR